MRCSLGSVLRFSRCFSHIHQGRSSLLNCTLLQALRCLHYFTILPTTIFSLTNYTLLFCTIVPSTVLYYSIVPSTVLYCTRVVRDLTSQHGGLGCEYRRSQVGYPKKVMLAAGFIQSTLLHGLANVSIVHCIYFHKRAPKSTATHLRGIAMRRQISGAKGCYRTKLLPSLTAEWQETSPPKTGV